MSEDEAWALLIENGWLEGSTDIPKILVHLIDRINYLENKIREQENGWR